MAQEQKFQNRLVNEKSPYLLQHKNNPVDWYPWGEEAFEKARAEDKPIFLSIGYSTCHWCHVMEEESFENPDVAKVMNEHFISVKVDREERPDVDQIYMQAVQAMTGSGGWPMSMFLTPDLKPFFGGTYFPPEDRWGRPGFVSILKNLHEQWTSKRDQILAASESIVDDLKASLNKQVDESHNIGEDTLAKAYDYFSRSFDPQFGGFGRAPKFPRSHVMSFLLRYWKKTGNEQALVSVEKTLQEMRYGGIYDHLGGGFHRYSTDSKWHVPHFEKMLYDQAIISKTYLEAFQVTGNEDYRETVRETLDYVLRDMTHDNGGFYSAEDADSIVDASNPHEKAEGAFFVWTKEEVEALLGPDDAVIFNAYFGVLPNGNAENDPHGEFKGKNILYIANSLQNIATKTGKTMDQVRDSLSNSKEKLYQEREKRPRPHLDDKVLTDWNGLMISSFAVASRVLNEPKYLEAAKRSADFIISTMKRSDGRLMHRWREDETKITGFIEDYAFFVHGLIDLYEASFDPKYLEEAQFLSKEMVRLFWDSENGGFVFTGSDAEQLITSAKELYDGAIPSGNSVATLDLARVARLTMDRELESYATQAFDTFSAQLARFPAGFPQMLIAFDFVLGPSREIVLAGSASDKTIQAMLNLIYHQFIPNKVVLLHDEKSADAKKLHKLAPFVERQKALGGKPTAYVCKNHVCDFPASNLDKLEQLLKK